jgi:hypothetical protein
MPGTCRVEFIHGRGRLSIPSLGGCKMSCATIILGSCARLTLVCAVPILLIAFPPSVFADDPSDRFISVGLGGGRAMYAPSCSPHDHNLMFVACDMGDHRQTAILRDHAVPYEQRQKDSE